MHGLAREPQAARHSCDAEIATRLRDCLEQSPVGKLETEGGTQTAARGQDQPAGSFHGSDELDCLVGPRTQKLETVSAHGSAGGFNGWPGQYGARESRQAT